MKIQNSTRIKIVKFLNAPVNDDLIYEEMKR